jgi:hypothetical protein
MAIGDHNNRRSSERHAYDLLRREGFPSEAAARIAGETALATHQGLDKTNGTRRLRTVPDGPASDLVTPWPWQRPKD